MCVEFGKRGIYLIVGVPREVDDFVSLRELILVEEFKKSLPESMLVHFIEQKISSLSAAAVMGDECVLILKVVFPALASPERSSVTSMPLSGTGQEDAAHKEERVCFYCRKPGHIISVLH